MPKCFMHSVRGYKEKKFWGCQADSRNVMLTRSGLVIRTTPAICAAKRSHHNSPADLELQTRILPKTSQKHYVDQSLNELSFVTRYLLKQRGNDIDDPGEENFREMSETWLPDDIDAPVIECHKTSNSKEEHKKPSHSLVFQTKYPSWVHGLSNYTSISQGNYTCTPPILQQNISNTSWKAQEHSSHSATAQEVNPKATWYKFGSLKEATDVASAAETLVAMATGSQDHFAIFPIANKVVQENFSRPGGMLGANNGASSSNRQRPLVSNHQIIAKSTAVTANAGVLGLQLARDKPSHIRVRVIPHQDNRPIIKLQKSALSTEQFAFPSASHSFAIDANGNDIHKCRVCGKVFTVLGAYLSHASTHNRSKNNCKVCGKNFSRSWLLKGHMRTHTGERPYVCQFPGCKKAFADKSNLRSHSLIHNSNGKTHKCERCQRAFAQRRYLHKHLLEVCKA